jgi:hypothetical protein
VEGEQMRHIALAGRRGVRRKAGGETGGQPVSRRGRELALPGGELGQQPELLVLQLGDGRRALVLDRGAGQSEGLLRPVPGHDRPGHQVAQSLPPRVKRHQQHADHVRRRQQIGDPEQVACDRGAERHRMPCVHDDPDSGDPLARRLAAPHPLEQDEVSVPDHEPAEDEQHGATRPIVKPKPARIEDQQDRERRADEDRHVEHRRERAEPIPAISRSSTTCSGVSISRC